MNKNDLSGLFVVSRKLLDSMKNLEVMNVKTMDSELLELIDLILNNKKVCSYNIPKDNYKHYFNYSEMDRKEREKIQLNIYNINIENIHINKEKEIEKSKANKFFRGIMKTIGTITDIIKIVIKIIESININYIYKYRIV